MYLIYIASGDIYKPLRIKPNGEVDYVDLAAMRPPYAINGPGAQQIHIIQGGAAFFTGFSTIADPPWNGKGRKEYWRWEGENWIRELLLEVEPGRLARIDCSAIDAQGHVYAIMYHDWREGVDPDRGGFRGDLKYLYTRLDPRIGP